MNAPQHAPPVADSRSRVGLLVMDGLLIVLMGWLLYTVIAARAAESAEQQEGVRAGGETTESESSAQDGAPGDGGVDPQSGDRDLEGQGSGEPADTGTGTGTEERSNG